MALLEGLCYRSHEYINSFLKPNDRKFGGMGAGVTETATKLAD